MAYIITGTVIPGYGRGGETGAHTANFDVELASRQSMPKGLYACTAVINNTTYDGLLYYGYNSLSQEDCLELHLFEFSKGLEGVHIEVTTTKFKRPEMRFANVEELRKQIEIDLSS
jgi:riboflavin kinase/FMN adenylyltransferase